jgi:biopolymer transport protein ExbB
MVIIRKTVQFRSMDADARLLRDRVFALVRENNIKDAVSACDTSASWGGPVFRAGLLRFGSSRREIVDAMQEAARFEVPGLEQGLGALATIAGVAPLMGLLGTVLGLCGAFHTIQIRAAAMNPATAGDIAGGIWQALITTVFGLLVTIPSFLAHNHFVNSLHLAVRDMEKDAARLADLLTRVSGAPVAGEE